MAQELICTRCRHSRRGHSKNGCGEMLRNGHDCNCKVKFMEQGLFMMGEPKKEW
jgi:hypothetical protein